MTKLTQFLCGAAFGAVMPYVWLQSDDAVVVGLGALIGGVCSVLVHRGKL